MLEQVEALSRLAKRLQCKGNLIPYNPVDGIELKRPSDETVGQFRDALHHHGGGWHDIKHRAPDASWARAWHSGGCLRNGTTPAAGGARAGEGHRAEGLQRRRRARPRDLHQNLVKI